MCRMTVLIVSFNIIFRRTQNYSLIITRNNFNTIIVQHNIITQRTNYSLLSGS